MTTSPAWTVGAVQVIVLVCDGRGKFRSAASTKVKHTGSFAEMNKLFCEKHKTNGQSMAKVFKEYVHNYTEYCLSEFKYTVNP